MPDTQADRIEPVEVDAIPEKGEVFLAGDEPCSERPLTARLEALLVSHDKPLSDARLAALAGLAPKGASKLVRDAIRELNDQYAQTGRSFRIERLAGGYQILTEAVYGPLLLRLHVERQQGRLSPAALETLAIVAYRQPIMRAEIEAIRGVSAGEVLRGLLERRLVKITGRADLLGRPMLYGTTRQFLQVFGLGTVDDLPLVEGIERGNIRQVEVVEPDELPADGEASPE